MVMLDGEPDVWLDDARRSRNHSASVSKVAEANTYRVLVSSPTNRELKENHGALVHMTLELAQYHDAGHFPINFTDIVMTEPDETRHSAGAFTQTVRFRYLQGDANADADVDVADYTVTQLHILERPTVRFYNDAANVNGDAGIDVADLAGITNIALGIRQGEVRFAPRAGQTVTPLLAAEPAGGNTVVDLRLTNDCPLAAMQLDLCLPQGVTLAAAAPQGRAARHQLATATLADGTVRLLLSAFSGDDIEGGDDAVLRLTLDGATTGGGTLEADGIVAVERDLTRHELAPLRVTLSTTGAGDPAAERARIYVENNQLVIDSPADGTAQLVRVNGIATPLTVNAGHNTFTLDQGVYIVRMGAAAAKIMIKP